MKRNNLTAEDVAWLVPHQANLRIISATRERMELPEEKVMINIQKYGNTTSATIPLCLYEWEKQLHKGDNLIFAAFGGFGQAAHVRSTAPRCANNITNFATERAENALLISCHSILIVLIVIIKGFDCEFCPRATRWRKTNVF